MSTRCQVKVKQSGLSWDAEIMLYHHSDGYPEHMIPVIHKAFVEGMKPTDYGTFKSENAWSMGRTGHVGAMLCHVEPRQFEVESGMALHGDIEYLYEIELVNTQDGTLAEKPKWIVSYNEDGKRVKGEITELVKRFAKVNHAA